MPIYEYSCPECGTIEIIQKITDDALEKCPVCEEIGKSNSVHRLISSTSFLLKGSGWYKTDYASSASSNGNGKCSKEASKDSDLSSKVEKKPDGDTKKEKTSKPTSGSDSTSKPASTKSA